MRNEVLPTIVSGMFLQMITDDINLINVKMVKQYDINDWKKHRQQRFRLLRLEPMLRQNKSDTAAKDRTTTD